MSKKQNEIIQALRVKPHIDATGEIRRSIDFIKAYLYRYPFIKTVVLGISGGQDSTLTGKLCQLAINEIRDETKENAYQFIAVRLPYGIQADEDDAQAALEFIQPNQSLSVNIQAAVDAQVTALNQAGVVVTDYNKGNIKARQRMITQYAIAGANQGVVVGTDHAAEAVTGFYTKFGDGAADITPIWRLNKRQGKAMLQALDCPKHLYEKAPTADLEEDKPQQPDEVALGVAYSDIDDYLEGKKVSKETENTIETWYNKSQHKRHLPITVYDTWWQADHV